MDYKRFRVYLAFFSAILLTCLLLNGCFHTDITERHTNAQTNDNRSNVNQNTTNDILDGIENPCDFRSEKGLFEQPGSKKLYELINAGYPKEISIDEAVAVFNKFAQCSETGKSQPGLRKEEIIAAIRIWNCERDAPLMIKKRRCRI